MTAGHNDAGPMSVPTPVKDAGVFGSVCKNVILPLVGTPLSCVLGTNVDWVVGVLFFACVVIYVCFNIATSGISIANQAAQAMVLEVKIPTSRERQTVANQLASLEKRYRYALFAVVTILGILILSAGGYFSYRWWTKRVPSNLSFQSAVRLSPITHKAWLTKNPFIEAVTGHLEEEGKAANQQSQIMLLKTTLLSHPTPAFELTVNFEEQSYSIAGYGFRKRADAKGDQFEAVSVRYDRPNAIHLDVPPCEFGDEILIVARVSLNGAKEFPEGFSDWLKTSINTLRETK